MVFWINNVNIVNNNSARFCTYSLHEFQNLLISDSFDYLNFTNNQNVKET